MGLALGFSQGCTSACDPCDKPVVVDRVQTERGR